MKNNELLTRICHVIDINETDMVTIFKHGGLDFTTDDVNKMMIDLNASEDDEETDTSDVHVCDYGMLESFLNGLIIFKRGPKPDSGKPQKAALTIVSPKSVNNIVLKKMKIALSLTGDDLVEVLETVDVKVSNRELSPYFRVEGHKHYKRCNDAFLISFLNGLAAQK